MIKITNNFPRIAELDLRSQSEGAVSHTDGGKKTTNISMGLWSPIVKPSTTQGHKLLLRAQVISTGCSYF
jgi:hypothetical protein